MIVVLGATSYVGQAFARVLRRRKALFIPLSREAFDYTRFEFLFDYIRKIRPELVINATGYPDNLNKGADEPDRAELFQVNTLLPQTLVHVCDLTNTAWGHVSSGSIYAGAKVVAKGGLQVERDLASPALRTLFNLHRERFLGFSELDEPNRSFKSAASPFSCGTIALAEETIRNQGHGYIWRLSLPFNELDDPRNFLAQLQTAPNIHHTVNSLSQLDECVGACLDLWERRAPFGIYNVNNPGAVSHAEVIEMIRRILKRPTKFELSIYESCKIQVVTTLSDFMLDASKVLNTGVRLRPVKEALEKSLKQWRPSKIERPIDEGFPVSSRR